METSVSAKKHYILHYIDSGGYSPKSVQDKKKIIIINIDTIILTIHISIVCYFYFHFYCIYYDTLKYIIL